MPLRWDSKSRTMVETTGKRGRNVSKEHDTLTAARKKVNGKNTFSVAYSLRTDSNNNVAGPNITKAIAASWCKNNGLRLVSFTYVNENTASVVVDSAK